MKEQEARLLIEAGAVLEVVATAQQEDTGVVWELWIHYGEELRGGRIEVARGGVRQFKTLDSLHRFVRALGWLHRFSIEG